MINASELRLGNRCTYGAHGVVVVSEIKESGKVRITHMEQHSINMGYSSSLLHEDDIDPIPLTREILEKCGFDKSGLYGWVNRVDEYSLLIVQDNGRFELMDITSGETVLSWDTRVEYLHQLQNLFFSLAGDELEVKL